MRVVTVDGGCPIADAPAAESVGILYPGERMDVLVDRPKNSDPTAFVIALDREYEPHCDRCPFPPLTLILVGISNSKTLP